MKKNNKKGFTLVELVIVVAVMAVLVAVAIPVIGNITNSAQNAVDESNARTIESMIKVSEAKLSSDVVATIDDGSDPVDDQNTTYAQFVQTELTAAKLGITGTSSADKVFYYDIATGNCTISKTADITASVDLVIKFNASGAVSVDIVPAAN